MKRRAVWKLSVATTTEAEDAVAEVLTRLTGQPASSHTDLRTGRTTVSAYGDQALPALAAVRTSLRQALAELKSFGITIGSGRIQYQILPPENWAESWKRHFKPIEIGTALLIKPSWIRRRPRRGQRLVILDPGLSFGTGQHATTGFCLRELARRRRPHTDQSVLDMGTGSGILAIAAAKLGYRPVEAFDFDPDAVRIARANARRNRVTTGLQISIKDLTRQPMVPVKVFDIVCANLIATLLESEARRIVSRLKPGGVLVVAGILTREFRGIRRVFETQGLDFLTSRRQREWTSGSFRLRMRKN